MTTKAQLILSSESVEWYTPSEILDAVYAVFGGIPDLDPCSDPDFNVSAMHYYTKDDNGLEQHWLGKIFLNPPFGTAGGGTLKWCEKLMQSPDVNEYIALVAANTDTRFFHQMVEYSDITLFAKGRLQFIPGKGKESAGRSTVKNVIFYKGKNADRFREHFGQFGLMMGVIDRPQKEASHDNYPFREKPVLDDFLKDYLRALGAAAAYALEGGKTQIYKDTAPLSGAWCKGLAIGSEALSNR